MFGQYITLTPVFTGALFETAKSPLNYTLFSFWNTFKVLFLFSPKKRLPLFLWVGRQELARIRPEEVWWEGGGWEIMGFQQFLSRKLTFIICKVMIQKKMGKYPLKWRKFNLWGHPDPKPDPFIAIFGSLLKFYWNDNPKISRFI